MNENGTYDRVGTVGVVGVVGAVGVLWWPNFVVSQEIDAMGP